MANQRQVYNIFKKYLLYSMTVCGVNEIRHVVTVMCQEVVGHPVHFQLRFYE